MDHSRCFAYTTKFISGEYTCGNGETMSIPECGSTQRVIELDLQRLLNYLCGLHMMPVKKNKSLLVIDESRCIYKIDVGYAC
jgi:hypothetical protein